jgi:hypothetical protein
MKPLLDLRDFRPPQNGERVIAEAGHMKGTGWASFVESALLKIANAINALGEKFEGHVNTILAEVRARPPRPPLESWSDISAVQNLDDAKEAARHLREREREWRERAERAEAAELQARLDDQKQLDGANAQVRKLLGVIKGIVLTIITLALGSGTLFAVRELRKDHDEKPPAALPAP